MNNIVKTATFLFMTIILNLNAQQRPVPFEEGELWGYQHRNGEVVIKPQFIIAREFLKTGIAAVADSAGWAYINMQGEVLIRPFMVDNGPDDFSQGLARFISDGKFGFFDSTGQVVIAPQFDFAGPFREDRGVVATGCRVNWDGEMRIWEGGCWGFIDRQGKIVIPLRYQAVESFRDGLARVKRGERWFTIDRSGEEVNEHVKDQSGTK